MDIVLPAGASTSEPASASALRRLSSMLGPAAECLMPLYRITNGYAGVVRGGELYLQLWPIEDFAWRGESLLAIGSDGANATVIVNTGEGTDRVEFWCAFGGGRIATLCPLRGFLDWMLEARAG